MRSGTNKTIWRKAQTLSLIVFAALGAVLWGLWLLVEQLKPTDYQDLLEGAILFAAYFTIFTVTPMTNFFYARLSRR